MHKGIKSFLILIGLVGLSGMCSCSTSEEALNEEPLSRSAISLYAIDTTIPQEQTQEAELVLTGDQILWFTQRTREIKFKDFAPTSKTFPPYKKIQFKLGDEVLFEANAYVNAIYSQVFTDLVIFHDLEKDTYYLKDCYPPLEQVLNSEETKANIKAREKNWNRFLEALKSEKRLK